MTTPRTDRLPHAAPTIGVGPTRRRTLLHRAALAAGLIGAITLRPAAALAAKEKDKGKGKGKRKKPKPLCRENGSPCRRKSETCRARNCLTTTFTVEASWTGTNKLYATYLFVPKDPGNRVPGPFISSTSNIACTAAATGCEENVYPFACIDQGTPGTGPATTTIRRLLKGTYEYWIYVISNSAADAVTVTLRDADAEVVRTWSSPANPNGFFISWHVFDVDGATGAVSSLNDSSDSGLPGGAQFPNTNVCPAA
jgi:hypothetical protein